MKRLIGVLALQGDFAKHQKMLVNSGVDTVQVKTVYDLNKCDGLVIPGGESTTLTKLIKAYDLYEPIRKFAEGKPVMGTCAGLIMLANNVDDSRVKPFGLLDITVSRNAYGRQIDSFVDDLDIKFVNEKEDDFKGVFIRAPKILEVNDSAEVLIYHNNSPVMVRQNNIIGLSFHPELTDDTRIHEYFLSI
ncbi:MAG TPA: pyridoxal 5'-phosphate synthase glutaminase subunit PdxT [Victivallales bacterium]|nr:pyridoxal 5'-phosphate synthase glutaminase subunit PdxT [Victivallales bacterium]